MSASKIIDQLVKQPRENVEADLRRVQAERAQREEEERFLEAILRLQGGDTPKAEDGAKAVASGGGSMTVVAGQHDDRRVTVRDHILAVMVPTGFEPWSIQRTIAAVLKRDPSIQEGAVRVALRRMHKDGTLIRDSDGAYRLDPSRQQGRLSIEAR